MARPLKSGLDYFPLDVDVFDDPKLLFVEEMFGEKGELITIKLLCWIYHKGYYCDWDQEHALVFAKKNFSNVGAALCQEVVNELVRRRFFDEAVLSRFGILTSRAIQDRWQTVITQLKRKAQIIPEYNLLLQEETHPKQEETPVKKEVSTQKKGKEKKEKESKILTPSEEQALQVCQHLLDSILRHNPNHKYASNKPDLTSAHWMVEVDRAIRIDGREVEKMINLITYTFTKSTKNAQFWSANIQSGKSLRTAYDQAKQQYDLEKSHNSNTNGTSSSRKAADPAKVAATTSSYFRSYG